MSDNKKHFLLLGLLAVLSVSGCALNSKIVLPVKDNIAQNVDSSEIHVVVTQQEIYAEINRSNMTGGMGGGLLWALIDSAVDSSRTEDKEKAIQPIRDALIDLNVGKVLSNSFSGKLKSVKWLNPTGVKVINKGVDDSEVKQLTKSSSASAVMFIYTKYYLTANLATLKVSVNAELRPNNKKLMKLGENNQTEEPMLYKNSYTFEVSLTDKYEPEEKKIQEWTGNSDKNIKNGLLNGFESVSNWLANDLKAIKATKLVKID